MNIRNKAKRFGKVLATTVSSTSAVLATGIKAYASGWIENVDINSNIGNTDPFSLLGGLVGVIIAIFKFVGIILVFMGLAQLLMGFNSENPDSMSRGSKTFIIGLCMVSIRFLLGPSVLGVIN